MAEENRKIAFVTGANKGIGFNICRLLLQQEPSLQILLGARSQELGQQAVTALLKEFPSHHVEWVSIDLDNEETIKKAAEYVKTKYGSLDILVNNAARAWKGNAFNEEVASTTIRTNYTGTKDVCNHFLPLIRPNGRIVNVSSQAGKLSQLPSAIPHPCPHLGKVPTTKLKDTFLSPSLSVEELDALTKQFVENVRDGTHEKNGWPNSTYSVSKIALNAFTQILQRNQEYQKKGILVYSCCPGYCKTDMSSGHGNKTAEQGAETPTWLALQPKEGAVPLGFYTEKRKIDW